MSEYQALRQLFETGEARVAFAERAEPVPGDLRLAWRLVVLCLILDRSHGGKASMQAAHVLWWAIRSPRSRRLFLRWHKQEQDPDELLVRFDPSLTATMDLAIGAGLIAVDSNVNLVLLPAGKQLAVDAWAARGVLDVEKSFLDALPRRITQKSIRELLEWK
ncbi:MAG: hypothetical protein KDB63_02215 [Nocardioidaceae bacterium]|nr:hypothetical protein [Nocardioidaceae bacterium]